MAKLVRKTLAQLAELPDSAIDFSEVPPLTEEFRANAVRNPYYRPLKQQLTVLREAMLEELRKRKLATVL
ncbi:MAG: hypothetical protein NTY38_21880 [Acidobacteria bacterium]|nr:hypothetical protein [Acidobacteriota bacterium]